MKFTADEETMNKRRLERLARLTFFMTSPKIPAAITRQFALSGTHNLLTGFFQNSHWRTAWYCVKRALDNAWTEFSVSCRVWYYTRVLRLSEKQIDERF